MREIRKRPELGRLIYDREVLLWMNRMEQAGYTMVAKPSEPRLTPSPNPADPPGSKWAIVEARFFHHGPIGILHNNDVVQFREEMAQMGAAKEKEGAGVARWLEGMTDEQAARAVQGAAPAKETDDDREHWN